MVAIAAIALADHRAKGRALRAASVAAWFCHHRNERCGARTAQAVEAGWNRRERDYVLAGAALGLVAVGSGVAAARMRTRDVGG
jgi:hypothetical protein